MLTKASFQAHKNIEEFYRELAASQDSVSAGTGQAMLELLPLLADVCGPHRVWGLTSLYQLWLLPEDATTALWTVGIQAFPGQGYRVEYRMPPTEAPWPDACVEGFARDASSAATLVAIAIQRSGAWEGA